MSEQSDRFSSLASMIPGVVYQRIVTPKGDIRYTYISEGARDMFGVSPEEILRDPEALFGTYSDEYKANFRQKLIAASKTLTTWDVQASFVTPDGQTRHTHAIAKPERLADGTVMWTGLILDATRIKKAEEELKEANRSVEAANRAKSLFLANMSHEIRTPMNGVLGMSELLAKTGLSARQRRLLSTLMHSSRTLLAIINDVLDISRIEVGRVQLEARPFDLRHCIEDAFELCAAEGYRKGIEVNLLAAGNVSAIVEGDQGRLRQVLINLIGNAVKFTLEGEVTVRVSATPAADGYTNVSIEIRDTGIGIDAASMTKLFAPFTQADPTISRRFGGTGLGLAITRHLVSLMGGEINLESELGKGTTISFSLSYRVVEEAGKASVEQPADLAGQRVLIVDDRASTRDMLALNLEGFGARTEYAESVDVMIERMVLAATEGRPFALAVVDRPNPYVASALLRDMLLARPEIAKTAVIILVPMSWQGEAADELASRGTVVTLSKPLRRAEMIKVANSCLRAVGTCKSGKAIEAEAVGPVDAVRPDLAGLKVLLAEDNPVNQLVAGEYLGGFGCEVTVANNGLEAVASFEGGQFDVILMDCQMPELDGLSAASRIREIEGARGAARIPIIAVTANAYDSDRLKSLEAGMNDHLNKPFSEDELQNILAAWTRERDRQAVALASEGFM